MDLFKLPYTDMRPQRQEWLAQQPKNPPMVSIPCTQGACLILPVHMSPCYMCTICPCPLLSYVGDLQRWNSLARRSPRHREPHCAMVLQNKDKIGHARRMKNPKKLAQSKKKPLQARYQVGNRVVLTRDPKLVEEYRN